MMDIDKISEILDDAPNAEVIDACEGADYVDIEGKAGSSTFQKIANEGYIVSAVYERANMNSPAHNYKDGVRIWFTEFEIEEREITETVEEMVFK